MHLPSKQAYNSAMLRLLLLMAAMLHVEPARNPFAALAVYSGTWTVNAQHPFSGGTGPDTLINRCAATAAPPGEAFFTCEQIVNGKAAELVIFTLSKYPGTFGVANVLPNGHASSNTDLIIDPANSSHWTFVTHESAPGQPRYRTENTFHGPDAIHFEQFQSSDDGKTWMKTNEGDEARQHAA